MITLDLIQGALSYINSYQSGDQLPANEANDVLAVLNDMLASWSTDHDSVYGTDESILSFVGGGKYQYSIGIDPTGATTADFPIQRPMRITNAFTRITTTGGGYDYQIDIISQDRYIELGLKSIAYPWPTMLWYNNTFPFGQINFYGAPNGGGQLHLFTDTELGNLSLSQTVVMPPAYARAIKWNLAREICSMFGFPLTPQIEKLAHESFKLVKALNANPVPESNLDGELLGSRSDAGGILRGWY